MSDELLDRIDAVLGHEATVIDTDWEVSGDAMRSRPPGDDDTHPDESPTRGRSDTWEALSAAMSSAAHEVRAEALASGNGLFFDGRNITATPPQRRRRRGLRGDVLELLDTLGLTPHLEKVCAGIARRMRTLRIMRAPRQPRRGTIFVTLTADTTVFTQAMERAGRAAASVGTSFADLGEALRDALHDEISEQLERCLRLEHDKAEIRRIGQREKILARIWLHRRMDQMYADLGLTRDLEEPAP